MLGATRAPGPPGGPAPQPSPAGLGGQWPVAQPGGGSNGALAPGGLKLPPSSSLSTAMGPNGQLAAQQLMRPAVSPVPLQLGQQLTTPLMLSSTSNASAPTRPCPGNVGTTGPSSVTSSNAEVALSAQLPVFQGLHNPTLAQTSLGGSLPFAGPVGVPLPPLPLGSPLVGVPLGAGVAAAQGGLAPQPMGQVAKDPALLIASGILSEPGVVTPQQATGSGPGEGSVRDGTLAHSRPKELVRPMPAFRSSFVMGRPIPGKAAGPGTGAFEAATEVAAGQSDMRANPFEMSDAVQGVAMPAAVPSAMLMDGTASFDAPVSGASVSMFDGPKRDDVARQRVEDALDMFLARLPAWRAGQRDVGQTPLGEGSESDSRAGAAVGEETGKSRSDSQQRWWQRQKERSRSKSRRRPSPVPAPPRKGSMFDIGPQKALPPVPKKEKKEKKDRDRDRGREREKRDERCVSRSGSRGSSARGGRSSSRKRRK